MNEFRFFYFPGIPYDFNPWLPGVRGNHPDIEGTGYGLYNAKKDAESEGWELDYSSEPGKTVFRLRVK